MTVPATTARTRPAVHAYLVPVVREVPPQRPAAAGSTC